MELLSSLDKAGHGEYQLHTEMINKIFDRYDKDQTGFIDREECSMFLNDVAKYIVNDLLTPTSRFSQADIYSWAKDRIDANNDGKRSKSEVQKQLTSILNYYE